jgi:hypothetical protein
MEQSALDLYSALGLDQVKAFNSLRQAGSKFREDWILHTVDGAQVTDIGQSGGQIFTRGKQVKDKFLVSFSGVIPIPITSKYSDSTITTFDESDPINYAWDLTRMEAKAAEQARTRAVELQWVGGNLSLANWIGLLRVALGPNFNSNPMVRMLCWMSQNVPNVGVRAPSGKEYVTPTDTFAAVRAQVLIHAALAYENYVYEKDQAILGPVVVELAKFIWLSPIENTFKYKKMISVSKTTLCSLSTSGIVLRWKGGQMDSKGLASLHGYKASSFEQRMNDSIFSTVVRSQVLEERKKMKEAGLISTLDMWQRLEVDPVLPPTFIRYSCMLEVLKWAGYTRTDVALSIKEQFTFEVPENYDNEWVEFITSKWSRAFKDVIDQKRLLSYQEYLSRVPTLLTSRSAGSGSVKVSVKVDGKIFEVGGTNKRVAFYTHADKLLKPAAVSLSNAFDLKVRWGLGIRNVPAKATRAITLVPLPNILAEGIWLGLYDVIEAEPQFTTGKETGVIISDMWHLLVNTGCDDSNPVINLLNDFSTFDASELWENVRYPALRGLDRALRQRGLRGVQYGPWADVGQPLEMMWYPIEKGRMFKIPGSDGEEISYTGLSSGELLTLLINNISNDAFTDFFSENMVRLNLDKTFKLLLERFQGDDAYSVYRLASGSYSVKTHAALIDELSRSAGSCGFSVNKFKSTLRRMYAEYLKKTVVCGQHIPLLQMVVVGSERNAKPGDPISEVRSFCRKMATLVQRGASSNMYRRLSFAYFLLKSTFRRRPAAFQKERSKRVHPGFFMPPIDMYWLPRSFGGIGEYPWSTVAATKDSYLAMLLGEDEKLLDQANRTAAIVNVPMGNFERKVGRKVAAGDTQPPGAFDAGMQFVKLTMDKVRARESFNAQTKLRMGGITIDDSMKYTKLPENTISDAITSNPALTSLNAEARFLAGTQMEISAMSENYDQEAIQNLYGWAMAGKVKKVVELQELSPGPTFLPTLDESLQNIIRMFGVRTGKSAFDVSGKTILSILRRDPKFPRHITDKGIVAILTKPEIMIDSDRMMQVLVSIGASTENAALVSERVQNLQSSFELAQAAGAESHNDQLLPNLDLGLATHRRVGMPDLGAQKDLSQLVSDVLLTRSMVEGDSEGKFYGFDVEYSAGDLTLALKSLRRKTFIKDTELWEVYPE